MKMIPPPIITIMKIDITIDPGSRYWMYGTYGYTSTTSRVAWPESRGWSAAGWLNADTRPPRVAASAEDTNWSVLSSISATRGFSLREHPAREVRRDRQHAVDPPVPQVVQRLSLVGVLDRVEGPARWPRRRRTARGSSRPDTPWS